YVLPVVLTIALCLGAGLYYRSVLRRRRQLLLEEFRQRGVDLPASLITGQTLGYLTSGEVRAEIERRWFMSAALRPTMWNAFVEKKVDSEASEWGWDEITPFSGMYVSAEDVDGTNPGDRRESRLQRLFRRGPTSSSELMNTTKLGHVLPSPPQNKLRVAVLIAMPSAPVPAEGSAEGIPLACDAPGSKKPGDPKAIKPNSDTGDEIKSILPHLEFGVVEVDVCYPPSRNLWKSQN
ncbi:hypothetical protein H0H92_007330, partial [Tricholoma furcatifolium]